MIRRSLFAVAASLMMVSAFSATVVTLNDGNGVQPHYSLA